MNGLFRRGVTALVCATALIGLADVGTAQASPNLGCRGLTASYPDGTRLNPCMGYLNSSDVDYYSTGFYSSPTDIHLHQEIWSKPASQSGEPTTLVASWDGVVGPSSSPTNPTGSIGAGTHGRCYYTRLWFSDTGVDYGYAESPAVCF